MCVITVSRMIKYTGLGHSAGLLANSGLLGQINCPRSDENSEDSDTEDYSAVECKWVFSIPFLYIILILIHAVSTLLLDVFVHRKAYLLLLEWATSRKKWKRSNSSMQWTNSWTLVSYENYCIVLEYIILFLGVIKPGTIGADGKPRAVSHVLELTKDVPDERVDSDSDWSVS